ncbi:MFP1 attachment factor 1 [Capsicum chinense]|uniref:MAF1 n=1 Tax=Capsicum annuum TaxID=4072 RepID=A0A023JGD5_CAPAN|nr:MFP1 attachment factor 1 [Capsicum annuum]PHU20744.1 MFP1 attachment factor 1 [Capsicum chinense]AHI85711.1 stress-induced protein 6 [Capsicum annuum]ALU85323.1 MAF1 [Capsicum annuum]KAF3675022.1 MFP1 attachment factor 1 [Capsicum annuum]KAF3677550.1 MFP1 attachment factor 1 [Capsicum annuum]
MAEIDSPQSPESQIKPSTISFSIWPPTQRTRDAVINRLIESLSTPSILSKRYGTLPQDEASDAARRIEEEAFVAAGSTANGNDDGIEILEVYSKEISKRMIETVKSRSAPAAESEVESKALEAPAVAEESSTGEVESVETEP